MQDSIRQKSDKIHYQAQAIERLTEEVKRLEQRNRELETLVSGCGAVLQDIMRRMSNET